jgi:hypothetical protein
MFAYVFEVMKFCIFFATIALVMGHAEFVTMDSKFRVDPDGKMYCASALAIGDQMMGFPLSDDNGFFNVTLSDAKGRILKDGDTFSPHASHFIHFSGGR